MLRPLGPSSHVKQLCVGAAAVGAQKEQPPFGFSPHQGQPMAAGDMCLRGTCVCWGTNLPCPAGWTQGQLSVPFGQSSVPLWSMGTAQCPYWAQLHATIRHGDSSVPPLGTGTAQCPHWAQLCGPFRHRGGSCPHQAWGQLNVPIGHSSVPPSGTGTAQCPHQPWGQLSVPLGQSLVPPWGMGTALCPLWAQAWLSVPCGPGAIGVTVSGCSPPTLQRGFGWSRGQTGTQGTLRASLRPWHGLACVPTPSPDKGRV